MTSTVREVLRVVLQPPARGQPLRVEGLAPVGVVPAGAADPAAMGRGCSSCAPRHERLSLPAGRPPPPQLSGPGGQVCRKHCRVSTSRLRGTPCCEHASRRSPRRRRDPRRHQLPPRARVVPRLSPARHRAAAVAHPPAHGDGWRPADRARCATRRPTTRIGDEIRAAEKDLYMELIDEVEPLAGGARADRGARAAAATRSCWQAPRRATRSTTISTCWTCASSWTAGRPPPTSSTPSRTPIWSPPAKEKAGGGDAVMLGDSTWDCIAAERCGVPDRGPAHRRLLPGGAARGGRASACTSRSAS